MRIALTGATGYVGSHVLTELIEHGHEVDAIVRNEEEADTVRDRSATPVIADLYDQSAVVEILARSDGAVHTASPGDDTSADLDAAVISVAIEAFGNEGKPYVHISGLWIYGDNTDISEDSQLNPPAMVAWKPPLQERLLGVAGMRGVVIVSATAYGDGGGGVPGVLLGSPRDDAGSLIMLGSGQQHWATVHVRDLADCFRRVLEDGSARGTYVIGNGLSQTVAELTEAAAVAVGGAGAVPGSVDEAHARLGPYFADVLLLDQGTEAARARKELGWEPGHPGMVEELRSGSYRHSG
jgi:nucleoside-diphosphate-sugar epimerase